METQRHAFAKLDYLCVSVSLRPVKPELSDDQFVTGISVTFTYRLVSR